MLGITTTLLIIIAASVVLATGVPKRRDMVREPVKSNHRRDHR